MKKVLFCLVPLLFLLSACFSDPVQDDLIDYNNQDLKKPLSLKKKRLTHTILLQALTTRVTR
ncbi:hypothetical protein AAAC51_20015 [Priestia megaterium]